MAWASFTTDPESYFILMTRQAMANSPLDYDSLTFDYLAFTFSKALTMVDYKPLRMLRSCYCSSLWVLLTWAAVVGLGCSRRPAPVVKITCSWRGGAKLADALVAQPVERALMSTSGVQKIVSISSKTGTEIYVIGGEGGNGPAFISSITRALQSAKHLLPKDAAAPTVILLASARVIPTAEPKQVDEVSVLVDRAKCASMGISMEDIEAALKAADTNEPATEASVKRVASLLITRFDGKQVLLGDLTTVTLVKAPDIVIRRWP